MRLGLVTFLLTCSLGCSKPDASAPMSNSSSSGHVGHSEHPDSTDNPHEGHAKNAGATKYREMVVKTNPTSPTMETPTQFDIHISGNDGKLVGSFDVIHEKLVHLIIVRDGLDVFAHLHPEVDSTGRISGEFTFPKPGTYRLFADHQPSGQAPGVAIDQVVVAGTPVTAPSLITEMPTEVDVDGLTAKVALTTGQQESTVLFSMVDDKGQPVGDLQPYLGAMGHLVIISADGQEYVHAHPLNEATTAPDGKVSFAAHFPKPGVYKAWGQFQRQGTIFTVPFVLEHKTDGEHDGHAAQAHPAKSEFHQ